MTDPFNNPGSPVADQAGTLTLETFLDRFPEIDEENDGYAVTCPNHADRAPSLRVAYNPARKTLLLKCRAGCSKDAVLAALGLTISDLFNVEPGDVANIRSTGATPVPVSVANRAALAGYLHRAASRMHGPGADIEPAEYAERRFGITAERALSLGIGFDPGNTPSGRIILSKDLYRDTPRLVVPFNDLDGNPHYLQARSIDRDYAGRAKWSGPANPDGETWGRYGWFPGDTGWNEILLTEGPGDGLTSSGLGYDTLLIRGAALGLTDELADELARRFPDRRFILGGDNDVAGVIFNSLAGEKLAARGLLTGVLELPTSVDDLSAWREERPTDFPSLLAAAVRRAEPWTAPSAPPPSAVPQTPTSAPEDRVSQTELGNAQRLVRRMEGLLRHTPALGFLVWNGSAWEVDSRSRVRQAAQQSAIDLMNEALAMPQADEAQQKRRNRALSWAHDSQRSRGIEAVIKEVQALPGVAVAASDLDAHPDLLACNNGTVNLRTGDLKDADPADLLTMALSVDYDPSADAPRWELFLNECFPSAPEMVSYLQRLTGYGISGHATEQSYVLLHGTGGNGKSVFTSALYDVFRPITASVGIETFLAAGGQQDGSSASSDVASLRGHRLVLTSEAETGARLAEAKLKRLTGGDPITARFLYREPFTFMPQFLLFISTNAVPEVRDNSDGIWRRVKIVEWKEQFTGARRDNGLSAKLRSEAQGILAWAVRGAVAWYAEGLGEPKSVTDTVNHHRAESDKLLEFYPGALVDDPDGWITRADLYALYVEWCEKEGHSRPWQNTTLYQELIARGVQPAKRGTRGFKGIRKARPTDTLDDDERAAAMEPFTF